MPNGTLIDHTSSVSTTSYRNVALSDLQQLIQCHYRRALFRTPNSRCLHGSLYISYSFGGIQHMSYRTGPAFVNLTSEPEEDVFVNVDAFALEEYSRFLALIDQQMTNIALHIDEVRMSSTTRPMEFIPYRMQRPMEIMPFRMPLIMTEYSPVKHLCFELI